MLAVLLTLTSGSLVHAAPIENTATKSGAIAIGSGSKATSEDSVAIGNNNEASGSNSLAIGGGDGKWGSASNGGNKASGEHSIAIGRGNLSEGCSTITLGNSNSATEQDAVAIGCNSKATSGGIAMGTFAEAGDMEALAIGYEAKAQERFAVALGSGSSAKYASLALGYSAEAQTDESIALGAYALADRKPGIAGYDPGSGKMTDDTDNVWKSTVGALSIGGGLTDTEYSATPKEGFELSWYWNDFEQSFGDILSEELLNKQFDEMYPGMKYSRNIYATRQLTGLAAGSENTDAVNVAQLKAARTYLKEGDHIHLDTAINADKSTTYTVNVVTDGKVEKDNPNIVTGGTVWNETRPKQDGHYITVANPAGENLTVLDRELYSTNKRLDKVGAGAAALAALHPQDFNPEDKWDFAAGYGHYKGQNAMAIGAFYRPDSKTMFSVGGSIGGGENLINAGVSFKFGKASPYAGLSKASLTTVIEDQKTKINNLESRVASQNGTITELKTQNTALAAKVENQQAQIADIMRQLAELKK